MDSSKHQEHRRQKNTALMKASFITVLGAVLLACLFSFWRERTNPNQSAAQINKLDQMESKGIPGMSAKTIDGATVTTEAERGKVLIINFWASWCEPCVAEVPSLIELVKAFPGQVSLIAISGDNSLEDINAFLKSFPQMKDKNISIVWDEDHALMQKYGTERLPESYVVGKDGKLVKKIVGSINWHTSDSEAFIKELLAQK
jgi:thiol-disulfide isomerase/thioredoxin